MASSSSRFAPPAWLVGAVRSEPVAVPWAAVARAAVALVVPLVVGLAVGRPEYGALAAIGALSGVIGDTADAYRMRVLNIAVPQFFGAVGVTVGAAVYGHGWVAVAVVTGVALVSGMMSSIGAVASVSGLLLLLNAVVGAGLPMPGAWWVAPALLAGGGLLVLVLGLLAWPLRAQVPERAAVAAAYRAAADLLEAAGTERYPETRVALTTSLNRAYDLVLAHRARYHGRGPDLVRLVATLNAITPLTESAPAADQWATPLPPAIPAAVRTLADAIASGSAEAGRPDPVDDGSPAARVATQAVAHAADVIARRDLGPGDLEDRLGRPAALGARARATAHAALLSGASWRYGLRLALCIGLAQALVSLVPVPRSYWVALTITFVMKPDFGSVFSRAVLRAGGTVVGLVAAAAVLAQVPRGWWDVPVMLVLGALVPVFSARGYGYQTAAITPVILLLSDILNREGVGLLVPRLLDSLMGCAIALVAGYLLWPESWHTRVGDRLADAVDDTAAYITCAFAPDSDHVARARERRRLYRDLSAIRTEFQRALTEPPPTGRHAAAWWPLVVAVERIADATTGARVRVRHGADPPRTEEVAEVVGELLALSGNLRTSAVLREFRPEFSAVEDDSVLCPLRREVTAARAIASPRG